MIAQPWCNLIINQRRSYCIYVKRDSLMGLPSHQWDATDCSNIPSHLTCQCICLFFTTWINIFRDVRTPLSIWLHVNFGIFPVLKMRWIDLKVWWGSWWRSTKRILQSLLKHWSNTSVWRWKRVFLGVGAIALDRLFYCCSF